MNKLLLGVCLSLTMQLGNAQVAPQLGKDPVEAVVSAMTTEEKVSLLIGMGMPEVTGQTAVVGHTKKIVPGAAGTTRQIKRLGITPLVLTDGPAGVRISPKREGSDATYYCTAFPIATLLASTWNTELVENVGAAMGDETKEYGCDVLLAPALNIHRNPLCGRNFEYYSEDPVLTGKIATAMVNGVQSKGVGTSVKHFAANNQELNRTGNDARITPRALREIYLKGFEIVVKEASPWTFMSSYNRLNGEYTSESRDLLTTILREEWGYKGLVMTDWYGGINTAAQIHAGNDLLMPGRERQKVAIMKALEDGSLSMKDLDIDVTRMLNLIVQSPRFKKYSFSNRPNLEDHAKITRASASEGMVLLKNVNNTLPLANNIKKVAVYGTTSYDFIAGGTGSGDVHEAYTVSLEQGLENAGYLLDRDIKSQYAKYAPEALKNLKDPYPGVTFVTHPRIPEFVPETKDLAEKAKENDIAFITLGRISGEFIDRNIDGDFNLTEEEQALVKVVSEAFHKEGKKAIVILNIGGVIETASWKSIPDAILLAWQPGQEGGNSVADILSGKVNPSGKLPMTFPLNIQDVPSLKNFPEAAEIDLKKIFYNFLEGKQEHLDRKNIDYTNYEEGIYVGYRYFDSFGKEVSYPFGYGLSYTTFKYSSSKITPTNDGYSVQCTITNNGKKAGKEVAQLYIAAPGKSMDKPSKELKAFAKTPMLQPGESHSIVFNIKKADLASFDEEASQWVVESGKYKALIGSSASDIRLNETFNVKGGVTETVHPVLLPKEKINLLKK